MILGTKARYAVMAMVELAGRTGDAPVVLSELAQAQDIALPYLEQLFSKLRHGGLVHAVRGPGGGYVLAKPPCEIKIADIIQSVDESIKMTRCNKHAGNGCLSGKTQCLTHDLWEGLESRIYDYLQAISLDDVINRAISGKIFLPAVNHSSDKLVVR